ncbi:2-oxo acid dehydrogenase subunit E2 [Brumimicrobium glaciale]|jgi:2-oxoglutarate dehydrogenase E2 component (dihydrolipoamide succinyltransferase)|uniref:Dihydrolipoamide acetyltransferase component of pyruvate dehydrogenase complex n=1 Tax=Brumimicrobium glaciale TaxID=200475 RepID=A0A4Q4KGC4_9FLAO|nr:dihydrolipoamide acetyltransferase family protein [Brumimicrobium glaciale]RYM32172.1 2-oxo acid dehydrogenase subunit E2 [Brumimicrobium glaciale]
MSQVEIRLPKMGESVTEATITNWLKGVGDTIEMDEPLVEVATDKVDNELPSEVSGTVAKIFFEVDEVAQVGDVIALISTNGEVAAPEKKEVAAAADKVDNSVNEAIATVSGASDLDKNGPSGKFYSPLVRSIAEKEGIAMNELENISGTGQGGRVTKKDIFDYIENGGSKNAPAQQAAAPTAQPSAPQAAAKPAPKPSSAPLMEGDEIIEMDRMRKMIAAHMVMSKQTSPHVTSYVEADVTNIWNWRNKIKNEFKAKEGENFTFTPIFIEAIAKAIKDFPMINITVDGDRIIKKKNINIGMAAALPSGNLIVPVIKNADRLNLYGLAKKVNELANNARDNKLTADDIQGGTYTVTNVGTFGNVMGTPIINQPQVAIMAIGAIRKVPAVIETPDGDFIGIRYKMFLSHAYDHRVVDGSLGGMFVKRVADYLEAFDVNTKL